MNTLTFWYVIFISFSIWRKSMHRKFMDPGLISFTESWFTFNCKFYKQIGETSYWWDLKMNFENIASRVAFWMKVEDDYLALAETFLKTSFSKYAAVGSGSLSRRPGRWAGFQWTWPGTCAEGAQGEWNEPLLWLRWKSQEEKSWTRVWDFLIPCVSNNCQEREKVTFS